jgi:hypothetical protein
LPTFAEVPQRALKRVVFPAFGLPARATVSGFGSIDSIRSGGEHGGDLDVFGEFAADGESGATDGADQIAPARELAHLKRLAKAKIAELITGRPIQVADLEITSDLSLRETLEAVEFKILDGLVGHLVKLWCN